MHHASRACEPHQLPSHKENGRLSVPFADLESIVEQKTSQAIKKLEKQFKATFMAYTSTKDQGQRQQAHDKLERKPYSVVHKQNFQLKQTTKTHLHNKG